MIDNKSDAIYLGQYKQLNIKSCSTYTVNNNVDLEGDTLVIPDNVTLKCGKGIIKNGCLIGKDTKIIGKTSLFDHVTIKGSWNVPNISTDLFKDLSYDNALRNVVALSNDKVMNSIVISDGEYSFSFKKNGETGIAPASNTNVRIDGTLTLKPNDFTNYYVINIKGENIHVSGKGVIEGDKFTHTGSKGEWGMGVNFSHATKCSLSGLTIKNCWGDCVYVGSESKNCSITKCTLDNGRRQGISITCADGVKIADCKISNVGGTAPEYAIDVEPNANEAVKNVTITNATVDKCVGGFLIYSSKDNESYVNGAVFTKCTINSVGKKTPLAFTHCNNVKVYGCKVLDGHLKYDVSLNDVEGAILTDNTFKASKYVLNTISGTTFQNNIVYGGDICPVDVKNTFNRVFTNNVKNNKVIKK